MANGTEMLRFDSAFSGIASQLRLRWGTDVHASYTLREVNGEQLASTRIENSDRKPVFEAFEKPDGSFLVSSLPRLDWQATEDEKGMLRRSREALENCSPTVDDQ